MNERTRQAQALDRFFDEIVEDPLAPTPDELDPATADLVRMVVAVEQGAAPAAPPDEHARTRVWNRALAAAQATLRPKQRGLHWPWRRWSTTRRRLAGAILIVLIVMAIGSAVLPAARIRAGLLPCTEPTLSNPNCDTSARLDTMHLAAVGSGIATRDGATLPVHVLLSSKGEMYVRLHLVGLPVEPGSELTEPLRLAARDAGGQEYTPFFKVSSPRWSPYWIPDRDAQGSGSPFAYAYASFTGLPPDLAAVEVRVEGPAPVGTWAVQVPLTPVPQAGLAPEGPGVTHDGITVRVGSVATGGGVTAMQLIAQAPPGSTVDSLGSRDRRKRQLALVDDRGRRYVELGQQITGTGSGRPWANGLYVEDVLFPAAEPDAQAATLTIPQVVIEEQQLGEATLTVPIAGRKAGEQIPLNADLTLGPYTFRVTSAEIFDETGGNNRDLPLQLLLHLNSGDWREGRKVIGPGFRGTTLNGEPITRLAIPDFVGEAGQYAAVYMELPKRPATTVTVTFRELLVAVEGPWQLEVPLPSNR